jgi:sec-independent protein translocase protein TatA
MFGLGPTELIIIALIVLILFGAKRLPDIGKGLGGAIREFRNIKKELRSDRPDDQNQDGPGNKKNKDSIQDLEAKVTDKVLEQVPGAKKAKEIKEKADKIKEIIK